ncbi:MAG TPA: SH3 domain-containing protein [Chloroflexi bacterium]|nr:SH3 domain-containing protein [Chloroflexota bacterium]
MMNHRNVRAWRNSQRLTGLLVALVIVGFVVTPLALIPQPVTAQATVVDSKMAVVGLDGAALLDAPNGKAIAQLAPGDVLTALARTADNEFLQVTTDRGVEGWVATANVVVFGIDVLPVFTPPTPTPAPTATPTRQAAPTAQPTPTVRATATQAAATSTQALSAEATSAPAEEATTITLSGDDVIAVVVGVGAELYDAPAGKTVAALPGAEAVTVSGRNADGTWLMVTTLEGKEGWMRATELVVFGVEALPEMTGQESVAKPTVVATATLTVTTDVTRTASAPEAPVTAATQVGAPSPAAAPSPVALPAASTIGTANVAGARLNIRSGPGSDYRIIGKAAPGEELSIAARSEDGAWLLALRNDLPEGAGWVSAPLVRLAGSVNDLPVSAAILGGAMPSVAAPTPTPAVASTAPATTPAEESKASSASTPVATTSAAAQSAATPAVMRTGATGLTGTLVFQDGRGSIYAYDLARGEVRFLASGFDPAISRDGSKVVYLGSDGIHSINIDGSGDRLAFASSDLITSPKWSPDGERIVFSRIIGEYKCWQTEFFGCLTLRELRQRFPFVPPALLQKIFLSEYERVAFPNFGLTRVNAQGEDFRDIAALDSAQAPDWNEDGIVYQSKAGIEITQDTPDGATRSVQWGNWDWDPAWAPNGGPIVYQSREGSHWEIFRINPDGSGVVALTRPVTTLVDQLPSNVAPAFSPDGKQIVYLSNRRDDNEAGPWRLWVMNADGSNQRPLPIDIEINYGFGGEQVVSWGP